MWLKRLKILYYSHVISDFKGEKIVETFYEKQYPKKKKPNQKEIRVEIVTKRKIDKPYVNWKCHDNAFNSWIDNKDIT